MSFLCRILKTNTPTADILVRFIVGTIFLVGSGRWRLDVRLARKWLSESTVRGHN